MTESNLVKFYVIWEKANPFYKQEENTSYQPPTWYVREFDNLVAATTYYWQHRERRIQARLVKDISGMTLEDVWREAQHD